MSVCTYWNSDHIIQVLPNTELWEWPYLKGILASVPDSLKARYRFVITDHRTAVPDPDLQTVVFYLSNEDGRLPDYVKAVAALFTPYPPEASYPHVYPIPLGPGVWPVSKNPTPVEQRPVDVFFSGRKLHRRKAALDAMDRLERDPEVQTKVHRTQGFGQGLSQSEYSTALSQAKLVIAPEGNFSNVTFRHFEALQHGCVVISAPLPDAWCYRDFPGYQLTNWQHLPALVKGLLKRPAKLRSLRESAYTYHKRAWAPEAVASYIAQALSRAPDP